LTERIIVVTMEAYKLLLNFKVIRVKVEIERVLISREYEERRD